MLEAWKKGDKIQVTRKKIGGGTEQVLAEFQSLVGNGRQLWCLINGKRVRVSVSGTSGHEKNGNGKDAPAKAKPDAVAKSVKLEADKLAEKISAKSGATVKTKVVVKEPAKAPAKKTVSKTTAPKLNKTERVCIAIAKGTPAAEIIAAIGCDVSLASDWQAVIKACETGGAKFDDDVIMKRVGRPAHLVAKYYNIYLNAK